MLNNLLRRNLRWLLVLAVIVAASAGYLWWRGRPEAPQYVTAQATRGAVVRAVITTGTVNPVVTVQVGTYVSGVIQALYCDYNTQVKAGQLCAKIDSRPYQVVVDQDAANLVSGRAQLIKDKAGLAYAKTNYERDLKLLKKGIVSQDAVDSDKSAFEQGIAQVALDEATIEQREAALKAAQVNLDYTNIVSPVDGIVVSRSIDVGQTVAASFQTPTLFLIAKDLTKMQVDTNVSESDVGGAKIDQKASFTVEAYPNKTFWGRVTQVRQAPITVQNVVTYDVVVGVDNPDHELLPGMTANARIIVDERDNVLRVPQQALRYSPQGLSLQGGDGAGATETRPQQPGARVWVLRAGRSEPVPVVTGLDDGTFTEIVSGDLKPGDRVIVNEIRSERSDTRPQRPSFRF